MIVLYGAHWLPEQGLTTNVAFLLISYLLLFINSEIIIYKLEEDGTMNKKPLFILCKIISNISNNNLENALLTNVLHKLRFVGMIDGKI